MIRLYGVIGIILIILVEINFFLKIEPFASWYFPIVWIGYILIIDAMVYKIKKKSLLMNKPKYFIGLFILSAYFWYIFEIINIFIGNWNYVGVENFSTENSKNIFKYISFATVLPAFFETAELLLSIHIFDKIKFKKKHKIKKSFLFFMFLIGILCFFLPIFFSKFTFPLVWLSFFFILDPINYMNKQPSIIQHLKDRKLAIPLSLLVAGIILGFLWEFWNYYAVVKWTYDIPFVGFFKIFEMPILGYLGYFPFAFELYSMYWFTRSLFVQKEKVLI